MAVIKWVGAIVAVVVVAIIVVGAAMYFRLIPIPGPILTLLLGAKPPEYSARYYPPDTLAYAWVTLAPGGGQLDGMQDIWGRFNEYPAFRDLVDELQEEFEDDTGINFEEDVLPWAGPEISLGLLDFRSSIEEPIIVGMVAVRDQDAADEFLGKWLEYMEESEGADFDTDSYLGIDVVIEEDNEQAYALTKDWLVFTTGESALELIIERTTGENDDSLATNADFIDARSVLPERRFASGYVDARRAIDLIDLWEYFDPTGFGIAGMGNFAEQAPDWAAVSAAWVERGITVETVSPKTTVFQLEIADLQSPANLLPDDTIGFMAATFDPNIDNWRTALQEYELSAWLPDPEVIDDINLGLAEIAPINPPELRADSTIADVLDLGLRVVDQLTGIDLEGEFFDHLAGELILAVRDFDFAAVGDDPAANPVETAMLLSYREEGRNDLANTMDDLVGLLKTFAGLDTTPLDVGADDDAQVFDLAALFGDIGYAPGYVLHDGYLTVSSTENTLKTIVERQNGGGAALSATAEYQRAIGHLPDTRQFLGYVDLNKIIRRLDPDDLDMEPEEYRVLAEGIGTTAVSSTSGDVYDRANVVLTLFPE